jgi:hypothetical protein
MSEKSASYKSASYKSSAYKSVNDKPNQEQLNTMLEMYLANIIRRNTNESLELESKFGTRGIKPITRIEYDNVIKKLLSLDFKFKTTNNYLLRIQNEYKDIKTGATKMSFIRTEINGIKNIQTYCKEDKIENISKGGILFQQKQPFKPSADSPQLYPINFDDFNFRTTLSLEITMDDYSPIIKNIKEKWSDNKKTFRYLNRCTMVSSSFPFMVDLSIVKDSKRQGKFYVPEFNVKDSGVFDGLEKYEIEIECINSKIGVGTPFNTPAKLNQAMKQVIKYILSGLQGTNYPIAYSEQTTVLQDYMKLLWGKEYKEGARIGPKNFVGPSSYTLEIPNIAPLDPDSDVPNIRSNYTVTDKADGDRKLLYIHSNGHIYLINTNMQVQFTGAKTKNSDIFNTLIDGEHILHNKKREFINLYMAFDLYYIKGVDIRTKGFISSGTEKEKEKEKDHATFRLPMLAAIINKIKPESVMASASAAAAAPSPIRIEQKSFYFGSETENIFNGCAFILKKLKDGLFEYETDGLIFTPANMGVGTNKIGETTKPIKTTWKYSFKWKPAEYNTIDFLVTVKKNTNGAEFIGSIFQSGTNVMNASQLTQYKTLVLRVGFDEKEHGYINPCQDVLDDKLPNSENLDEEDGYKPVQFYPTNPSDSTAGICNIELTDDGTNKIMLSEAGEVIEDNMIVEFRYEFSREKEWRWVPLRVRYDKTSEFRAGLKNYGNAYHVANSNWRTIHKPITREMITTGEGIPTNLGDDDVYYNKVSESCLTQPLRNFHNLFIKKLLISRVSKPGDTLIDLAVGKAGDFPKWINAKLKFVFGIDISRDNIQNRLDGACARYLEYKKTFKVMPAALFVNGNSGVNIRNTTGLFSAKDKQTANAIFGQGAKDEKQLGKGVYKQYGIGKDGFDVCSIQFALHYMFESQETLQHFLRNVSEVTKVGGYFIGTSYDGKTIFNMLKDKKENESTAIIEDGKKIWEITKRYDRTDYDDNSSCVGFGIDVFCESINKSFKEYLVNYNYLTRILENYGFVLLTKEEAMQKHLPNGTGLFNELFTIMNNEIKANPRVANDYKKAPDMNANERTISFFNRFFVYKKMRNVDADKVALDLLHKTVDDEKDEEDLSARAQEAAATVVTKKVKPVKLKGKLKLTL